MTEEQPILAADPPVVAETPVIADTPVAAEAPDAVDVPRAPARHARWILFATVALTVVILDQLTKASLVSMLDPGERLEVVGTWLRLVHGQNSGALFGLFRDQAVLFGLVSLGVIGLIIAYHGRSGRNTYLTVALGLLLGGAIGNLLDRFRLGYVVDWIDVGIGDTRFWTFNVADAAVSTAIVLLIGLAIFPGFVARLGARIDA
jgi:signal peptidase II